MISQQIPINIIFSLLLLGFSLGTILLCKAQQFNSSFIEI